MTQTITVEGMTCGHCVQTVEDALREVSGVTDANADREAEQASVDGDADIKALVKAVEDAGYTASA
ncbi:MULTISPECIES: heavy metal-associated domain-containing protein [unclassified Haloferax]|jgi:copper chaperone|uniref:heavy-metal-associated domain-containing protein n=1 Tax=unclassified Haloferax TaxID=2625095 RepID=UPI002875F848|nr:MULTISPECIES: heavy metal-associated domain-containing protein [unclassified Haloferax]MDS0243858.1 heavy-metal-associated domain-containing protein [Haloferax sp. S2CR25]MDS0446979.1 heavy-metal-associated domain-containing protein [Haloferax sp. S2CR25-2]